MDVLIKYGFTIEEIKNIMDSNQEFDNIDDKDIYKIIDLLGSIGCLSNHIKNIFITNPFIFNYNYDNLVNLINYFKMIGLNNLYIIFDSNPFLFNIDYKELEKKYKKLLKEGLNDEEIKNYFYYELREVI